MSKWVYSMAGGLLALVVAVPAPAQQPAYLEAAQRAAIFYHRGEFRQAVAAGQEALRLARARFGEAHIDVAVAMNDLAEYYRSAGQFEAAEPLFRGALAVKEHLLGPFHPSVAVTLNNLAATERALGRLEAAAEGYWRAAEILFACRGNGGCVETEQALLTILGNLAALWVAEKKYARAEGLLNCALALDRQVGVLAPAEKANVLNNLGELYRRRGKLRLAEAPLLEALRLFEQTLGDRHPFTRIARANLAELYLARGEASRAALYRAVAKSAGPPVVLSDAKLSH